MDDNEYDEVLKECNYFLTKDRYGKIVSNEIRAVHRRIFRAGYELGKRVGINEMIKDKKKPYRKVVKTKHGGSIRRRKSREVGS